MCAVEGLTKTTKILLLTFKNPLQQVLHACTQTNTTHTSTHLICNTLSTPKRKHLNNKTAITLS